MCSFSLFLSSFKMLFLETTIYTSGLKSHITSKSSTLTLSFRFILSGSQVSFYGYCTSISIQALLPVCVVLTRLSSVRVIFSSFSCPLPHSSQSHPDHLINHIPWFVFLSYVLRCHFPVQAEFTIAKTVVLWEPPALTPFLSFLFSTLSLCCGQAGHPCQLHRLIRSLPIAGASGAQM